MGRICDICGKGPTSGNRIVRRGLAKKKGGIGLHTTAVSRRRFLPNLHKVRANVKGSIRNVKACGACLRSGKVNKVV